MLTDATVLQARRFTGLRANALAALTMLLLQFGLGMAVNLYVTLPKADHGQRLFGAFASAITGGPLVLALHALLGTLLLLTAIAAVVRAGMTRRPAHIALAAVGLLAILIAWLAGDSFVADGNTGSSFGMALATGVAILCYLLIVFMAPALPRGDDTRVSTVRR